MLRVCCAKWLERRASTEASRGPDLVANLEGRRPLIRDEDVVVFGFRDALAHLDRPDGPAGFWIQLGVDVLRTAVASNHATGLDITILNPTLDPDGPGRPHTPRR
ncbi:MAG TPA: hypothetical protein VFC13_01685, partial [Actinomycetes bacterium]|nr:hypothetical protein [Actinomycetes bacterium]